MKLYHICLIFVLMFSTSVSISSSSWLMAWFGLEMNLMAFIPLLVFNPSPSSSEASIKYFLTQALASLIIVFAGISMIKFLPLNSMDPSNNLISMALGVKAGMAPTHFWFPQVMELINWFQSSILLTWQKIAPLMLLFSAPSFSIIMIFVLSSCVIGSLGGFNINSLKKIMAYSSISHLAWMASSILLSIKLWTIYFSVYSFIILSVAWFFWVSSIDSISSISSLVSNKMTKMFLLFNILSMGGMPPLLGIFPKVMVINSFSLLSSQEMIILTALISSSVITLFFYLKIIYSILTLYNFKPSAVSQNLLHPSPFTSFFLVSSILGNLVITPLIVLF